ncbi:membrane protein [Streptomyces narbonensis]
MSRLTRPCTRSPSAHRTRRGATDGSPLELLRAWVAEGDCLRPGRRGRGRRQGRPGGRLHRSPGGPDVVGFRPAADLRHHDFLSSSAPSPWHSPRSSSTCCPRYCGPRSSRSSRTRGGLLYFHSSGAVVSWLPPFLFAAPLDGLPRVRREPDSDGAETSRDAVRRRHHPGPPALVTSAGIVDGGRVRDLRHPQHGGVQGARAWAWRRDPADAVVIRIFVLPALMTALGRWKPVAGQPELRPPRPDADRLRRDPSSCASRSRYRRPRRSAAGVRVTGDGQASSQGRVAPRHHQRRPSGLVRPAGQRLEAGQMQTD